MDLVLTKSSCGFDLTHLSKAQKHMVEKLESLMVYEPDEDVRVRGYIKADQYRAAILYCLENGLTISKLIRDALLTYLGLIDKYRGNRKHNIGSRGKTYSNEEVTHFNTYYGNQNQKQMMFDFERGDAKTVETFRQQKESDRRLENQEVFIRALLEKYEDAA